MAGGPSVEIPVRRAGPADATAIGRMLDDFNVEFGDPTPGAGFLAGRVAELITAKEVTVILAGRRPDGFAVLRVRPTLWSQRNEAYLEELYVAPDMRGQGVGRALLEATLDAAREAGCERIDLATGETDAAARGLYARLGFRNTERDPDGPVMLFYEREL